MLAPVIPTAGKSPSPINPPFRRIAAMSLRQNAVTTVVRGLIAATFIAIGLLPIVLSVTAPTGA
jgi:hypothetical protein